MRIFLATALCCASIAFAQPPGWVAKSNQNAKLLLDISAKYSPEDASEIGVSGLDEAISQPSLQSPVQHAGDLRHAAELLKQRLATEQDPNVHEDLEILIQSAERDAKDLEVRNARVLPYVNVPRRIFAGLQPLLSPQMTPDRRKAAVVRLNRYTGVDPSYKSLFERNEEIFLSKASQGSLLGPPRAEVEQDLSTMDSYVSGIQDLLLKFHQQGYEKALERLRAETENYKQFVRKEVLPRSRSDFRLPPDLYALRLSNVGVDYTPAELEKLAHASFAQIQAEMKTVAARVAKAHGFASSDYRDVIRQLKKDQLAANQVMPVYEDTLAHIEATIRANHLVSLPPRPCIIRIASAAETAQQPAPHYLAPPLLNNHGERGQFVLPGGTTGSNGEDLKYDDFTFRAAAWTLTAHEARPGHDLQFSAMLDDGISQARAIFAFNSTNVEGWALYAEWFMLPYMPEDGQLISLQLRLLRAARAFLDPELEEGKVTHDQALQLLENDVMLSKAFATEEVDRFTFRMPGQAVSYFDGYTRLLQLRRDVQAKLGPRFNTEQFHDFILSQGMVPPSLLREAVMKHFAK